MEEFNTKKCLITITMFMSALCVFIIKGSPITAYATSTPTLNVLVKCITADEASCYNSRLTTQNNVHCVAGDYAVSLVISDNTGFAVTGYSIEYNASLGTPVTYVDSSDLKTKPIFCKGNVIDNSDVTITASVNLMQHILGSGTMGTSNADSDGVIITYFIRPSQSLTLTQEQSLIVNHGADQWRDCNTAIITHDEVDGFTLYSYASGTPYTTWIIGDIDDDGYITAADAQLILSLYVDYSVGGAVPLYTTEYLGTFILANNDVADRLYVLTVSDVNSDGVVDVEDANAVLDYYSTYIAGQGNINNYTGIIGTAFGLYNEYIITF